MSATRGDADFAAFSAEVAKVLNDVAKIQDPAARLATAERARQKLADWPKSHYGYRVDEVRDALAVLDEVIAQLRVVDGHHAVRLVAERQCAAGGPPPPPLPPPTDAELVEQFVAAASIVDSPVERIGVLQTVMRLIDRAIGLMPAEWAARMRGTAASELERERRVEKAYDDLRTHALEEAAKLAARGEDVRPRAAARPRQGGGSPPRRAARRRRRGAAGDDRSADLGGDRESRDAQGVGAARAGLPQVPPLDQRRVQGVRRVAGRARAGEDDERPAGEHHCADDQAAGRGEQELPESGRARGARARARADLAARGSWRTTRSACALEAVSANSIDVAQRASSAAAGALMLYQRARADQLTVMEPPATK